MSWHRLPLLAAIGLMLMANTCQTTDTAAINDDPNYIEGALTGSQITGLLTGNTGYGEEEAYNWRVYFAGDGTISGRRWSQTMQETDQGTWEITPENQLCRQWSAKWDNRARACFEVFKDGEQIKLINMDGNADSFEMMVAEGNRLER